MLVSTNYEVVSAKDSVFSDYELSEAEIVTLKNTWDMLEQYDLKIISRGIFS